MGDGSARTRVPEAASSPAGADSLYLDARFGIAGDMLLAALLDLGADPSAVFGPLHRALPPFGARLETVARRGILSKRLTIEPAEHAPHQRTRAEVLAIIDGVALPPRAAERARAAFRLLAEAEGAVHGAPPERIHFHEVGAIDSLVDVLGTLLAVELLAPSRIVCSSLPLGSGSVATAHGVYPVPAPATLRLLAGIPSHPFAVDREVSTPTGVALARVLADGFGDAPAGRIGRIGYGAGSRIARDHEPPNLLRVWSVAESAHDEPRTCMLLETNIDHLSGEDAGHAMERLLAAGALDVFLIPTLQKKSRPGLLVTVLAPPDRVAEIERTLFIETGTLGVRRRTAERRVLARDWAEVEVPGGTVRVKRAYLDGVLVSARPEYEDLRRAAETSGRPVAELRRLAERALAADPQPPPEGTGSE